jgi:uncharacterized protein (TIGR02147 family)
MNIFNYTDYRKYLKDYYKEKKAEDRAFTVRYIARKVGFRSASFFSQLINGRSNMSTELVYKFCRFLELDNKEREYFESLVNYNQAKNHAQKKSLFEKLASFKQSKLRTIDANLYEYYDKWYYSAIRELLYFFPFRGDFRALAKTLNPQIRPTEAERAIMLLEKWGLITKDKNGGYVRSDSRSITTGTEAQSFFINNFQHAVLDLAKGALDRFPRDVRSFSTLTMSLSNNAYRRIEEEISQCRRRILSIAEEDTSEDTVYQMNVQLFPVTRSLQGTK